MHISEFSRCCLQWVAKQREQYKLLQKGRHSYLSPDRLEQLKSIGFVWSVKGDNVVKEKSTEAKKENNNDPKNTAAAESANPSTSKSSVRSSIIV